MNLLLLSGFVAAASTGDPLLDWLSQAGSLGILAFVVIAFMRRWIVTGSEVEKVRAERDQALEILLQMSQVSSKSLDLAEKGGTAK